MNKLNILPRALKALEEGGPHAWGKGKYAAEIDGTTRDPWDPRTACWCSFGRLYQAIGRAVPNDAFPPDALQSFWAQMRVLDRQPEFAAAGGFLAQAALEMFEDPELDSRRDNPDAVVTRANDHPDRTYEETVRWWRRAVELQEASCASVGAS